jgi:hypothetical protein
VVAGGWEDPDPGEVVSLTTDAEWLQLRERYSSDDQAPIVRCLEVARSAGAQCAVIETRYLDLDYRSEFSAFYSRAFQAIANSAHRLHFFREGLEGEELWCLPQQLTYLGYMVLRPEPLGVGRTMLVPPPGLAAGVRTGVTERVTLFGQQLEVTAVPFMEQDAHLDRCAHTAAWVAHYSAYRRGEVSRRAVAAFSLSADPSLGYGRPLPSEGLTVQQILEVLRIFDLPAKFYDIEQLPATISRLPTGQLEEPPSGLRDPRIISICCRYLNSGYPVLVGTDDHAFVLCGYDRQVRNEAPDWIRFLRQDDQVGPYVPIEDVFNDQRPDGHAYSPWRYLIVPLPEKLWVVAEHAEDAGYLFLTQVAQRASAAASDAASLLKLDEHSDLALRTYARGANDFKRALDGRVDDVILREYRLARFPRFVWVVEAVDRSRRRAQDPECVVGEVVFDATSVYDRPQPLAVHVPGVVMLFGTDGGQRTFRCKPGYYRSGGVGPA